MNMPIFSKPGFFLLLGFTLSCQLAAAQNNSCTANPHFNDFDFWVGEWDVTDNSNGNQAGTNTITKALNNCLVLEDWHGTGGSIGKSMNYFNPQSGQWRQLWVAPGYANDISGGLSEKSMILEGSISYYNDAAHEFRGSWTPHDDGSVRQFFEQYDAEQESWVPWFDGRYVRKI